MSTSALRPRVPPVALSALLALCACRAPAQEEVGLVALASANPGLGGGLALEQRLVPLGSGQLALEAGVERQVLQEEGPDGRNLTRAFAGLRLEPVPGEAGPQASLGASWVRNEGEPGELDGPGDYGGAHLGLGWAFPLGLAVTTGPELVLSWVDAEGTRGGSAALLELTWRVLWRP